jgi:hypothetical protein
MTFGLLLPGGTPATRVESLDTGPWTAYLMGDPDMLVLANFTADMDRISATTPDSTAMDGTAVDGTAADGTDRDNQYKEDYMERPVSDMAIRTMEP